MFGLISRFVHPYIMHLKLETNTIYHIKSSAYDPSVVIFYKDLSPLAGWACPRNSVELLLENELAEKYPERFHAHLISIYNPSSYNNDYLVNTLNRHFAGKEHVYYSPTSQKHLVLVENYFVTSNLGFKQLTANCILENSKKQVCVSFLRLNENKPKKQLSINWD